MFREIYKNAPHLGSGFSRILEKIENLDDLNTLTAEGSFIKTEESIF
jgi:hypothetical protein